MSGDRLTGAGSVLALAAGACFLFLAARRPPGVAAGGGRPRRWRARRLLTGLLRLLYLVTGLLLIVRAAFALSAG